jgi:hypothetical protein
MDGGMGGTAGLEREKTHSKNKRRTPPMDRSDGFQRLVLWIEEPQIDGKKFAN